MAPRKRWLLVILLLVVSTTAAVRWGLDRPADRVSPGATPGPSPLTAARYGRLLSQEAGGPIDPRELTVRARAIATELENRLTERARRIDPGARDWRTVFGRLREDTPPDADAVLAAYREENTRAEAFCRERDLVPLPPAPPAVFAIANPTLRRLFPLAMNRGDGTLGITLELPGDAAYRRNHCRVCIPPIAVHEAYPGHHVAFALARPGQAGNDSGRWPFFHEGWAQYAEVLLWEEGYWQGDPAREMGALRLMLLRAVRAQVDADLHGGGLTPDDARRLYTERLLLSEEAAASEVAGHLQHPTKKASYLVGALQVLALRHAVGAPRGAELRRFHERFLARPGAIPAVARNTFGVAIPALPDDRPLLASP